MERKPVITILFTDFILSFTAQMVSNSFSCHSDPPGGRPTLQLTISVVAAGEITVFTCVYNGKSSPAPERFVFYHYGKVQHQSESNIWHYKTQNVTDGGNYSCAAGNVFGTSNMSKTRYLSVQGN